MGEGVEREGFTATRRELGLETRQMRGHRLPVSFLTLSSGCIVLLATTSLCRSLYAMEALVKPAQVQAFSVDLAKTFFGPLDS